MTCSGGANYSGTAKCTATDRTRNRTRNRMRNAPANNADGGGQNVAANAPNAAANEPNAAVADGGQRVNVIQQQAATPDKFSDGDCCVRTKEIYSLESVSIRGPTILEHAPT